MIKLLSLADIITIMNVVMGFLAILMAFSNQFQLAAAFILLGLLADGVDGIVARRTGNGQIGEYLESIADMISLSVAPLVLLYKTYYDVVAPEFMLHLLLGVVLVFSLICSIIRLSSFSFLKEEHFFIGLPTSASALFLVSTSLLKLDIWYILPFIVIFALAMISSIRFPKTGLKTDLVAAVLIVAAILLDSMYNNIAPLLLLAAVVCYIVIGPFYLRIKKKKS
jgi:CDP-diacylglycerol--serine O-phosphatidyltransferase